MDSELVVFQIDAKWSNNSCDWIHVCLITLRIHVGVAECVNATITQVRKDLMKISARASYLLL